MSEELEKSGVAGPTTPAKSDAGAKRAVRPSDNADELVASGVVQKKGKASLSPKSSAANKTQEGATGGTAPASGRYEPRTPTSTYNRPPQAGYDARTPTSAYNRPPPPVFDTRTPAPVYNRPPPQPNFDTDSPTDYDRSPSAGYNRTSRGTYPDAKSPKAGYGGRTSGSPDRFSIEDAEVGARAAPQVAEDTPPQPDPRTPGHGADGGPAPGAGGGAPQSESGRRRSIGSPHPSGARSVTEEGTVNPNDAFNAEFSYYCAVLRTYAPSLSREYDKATTRLWMRKLFGPEYHPTVLKPKRNKYLLYLSITIYNDEAYGIFKQEPPCGKLPEIDDIPFDRDFPPAAWETEIQWTDTLAELPDELKMSECYLHDRDACPPNDEKLAGMLDAEFQFFLWLARPYVTLLPDPEEKTTAACWIRLLCGVASQREDCLALKEIRNDYMQALLGYVHDLRVEGPFRLMPPAGPLPPLALLYEDCLEDSEFADPAGNQAQEFLSIQRLPESGAFAYINVTGELFGNL